MNITHTIHKIIHPIKNNAMLHTGQPGTHSQMFGIAENLRGESHVNWADCTDKVGYWLLG